MPLLCGLVIPVLFVGMQLRVVFSVLILIVWQFAAYILWGRWVMQAKKKNAIASTQTLSKPDLDTVGNFIRSKAGFDKLFQFMAAEFSCENLMFIKDASKFIVSSTSCFDLQAMWSEANTLYSMYISPASTLCINISAENREQVEQSLLRFSRHNRSANKLAESGQNKQNSEFNFLQPPSRSAAESDSSMFEVRPASTGNTSPPPAASFHSDVTWGVRPSAENVSPRTTSPIVSSTTSSSPSCVIPSSPSEDFAVVDQEEGSSVSPRESGLDEIMEVASIFDSAIKEILNLIGKDSFTRFRKTKDFLERVGQPVGPSSMLVFSSQECMTESKLYNKRATIAQQAEQFEQKSQIPSVSNEKSA
eukprot:CAMPEP_0175148250 /NCGR_PEP_ID=MMETSP0087-20121206/16508_1 /TAXON_ID=136419 /ORGANISM="Unknown Unknown, Strain D1" /LENGTH=361 /DNA_ID=CAMNT_0016433659 /DNA_START=313 /DNA_END=1398 /DNA_ORIENTATION=-